MNDWSKRIDTAINNFLLPPFSELDIFIVVFLCLVLVADNFTLFLPALGGEVIQRIRANDWDSLLSLIFFIGLGVWVLFVIFWHLFSKREWRYSEIKSIGSLFYLGLGVLTVASYFGTGYALNGFEQGIRVYLLIKSALMVLLVSYLGKADKEHIYVERMSREQATLPQLIALAVLGVVVYVYLRNSYLYWDVVLYGYFYVGFGLRLLHPFLVRVRPGK